MSYDLSSTFRRLARQYKADYLTFNVVNGERVNKFGMTVNDAYAVVSDEQARTIDIAERARAI